MFVKKLWPPRSLLDGGGQAILVDSPNRVPPPVNQHHRNLFGVQARKPRVLQNIDLVEHRVDVFFRQRGSAPLDYRASVIAEVAPRLRQQRDGDGS